MKEKSVVVFESKYVSLVNTVSKCGFEIVRQFCIGETEDICSAGSDPFFSENSVENLIIFADNSNLKSVTAQLRSASVRNAYILPYDKQLNYQKLSAEELRRSLYKIDLKKPRLKLLQINLAQHCNLNCRGCANYSNIVGAPAFANAETVRRDLTRLKDFFWGIERLKLMGGEPLLNKNICDFVKNSRTIFPDALIHIATNGLLINDSLQTLFECMRQYHCEFAISVYPAYANRENSLETLLKKERIRFETYVFKGFFRKYLNETPRHSKEIGYIMCPARECHYLDNGILAICARPLFVHRLNERFQTAVPDNAGKWDIYSCDIDPWELDSLLRTPIETCRYCGPEEPIEWKAGKDHIVDKSDWFLPQNNLS